MRMSKTHGRDVHQSACDPVNFTADYLFTTAASKMCGSKNNTGIPFTQPAGHETSRGSSENLYP